MSVFNDAMNGTAWDAFSAQLGQSVTYTAYGVAGATITAVWHPNQTIAGYYPESQQDVEHGVLVCSADDVSSPGLRDTVTISNNTWAVASIGRREPFVELQLQRQTRVAIGRGHEVIR